MGFYIKNMVDTLEEAKNMWKEKPIGKSTNHTGEIIGNFKGIYRSEHPKEIVWVVQCIDCKKYTQKRWADLKRQSGKCNCQKEIINKKFNKLTILEYTKERASNGGIICKCKCDCGNIHYAEKSRILQKQVQSCGCLNKIDLTNLHQKEGRLKALKPTLERDNEGNILWECICDCGKICFVPATNFRREDIKSCGCYHKEQLIKMIKATAEQRGLKLQKDYSNQNIKGIKILTKAYVRKEGTHRGVYWNCQCPYCNNTFIARPCDLKEGQSCGCVGSSKNNKIIEQLLNINNIFFQKEFWFSNLRGLKNYPLRFDFVIYDNNNSLQYLIEYDGIQHFYYSNGQYTWNNKENYKKQHQHDLIKNKYCFDNNIPLIRIPYDADYTIEDLKLETTRFLLTPENEEEYYNSRGDKNGN